MSKPWHGRTRRNYNRPNRWKGWKGAKAKPAKAAGYQVAYRKPRKSRVFFSKEARRHQKFETQAMLNRRTPPTRRPQMLLYNKAAPEQMPWWQSAYVSGSVMPEYVAQNTNLLKLRQQTLPYGMKPRTIDAPDSY